MIEAASPPPQIADDSDSDRERTLLMRDLERRALASFDADDLDRARQVLEEAARAGPLTPRGLDLLDVLVGSDADASAIDPALVDAVLRHNDATLSAPARARWLARRFDVAQPSSREARERALDLLAGATLAGVAGWALIEEPARRARLDAALSDPDDRLDALEQEAFAPEATGLPASVPGRVLVFAREMVGRRRLDLVRSSERLLHTLNEPQLAYLVERERKGRRGPPRQARRRFDPGHVRLTIVIAGGHPALRQLARTTLDDLDLADVREFPSAWEGSRQGRHARSVIEGSDLAVVVWRQIAHSTADQIAVAARSLAVPVVRAGTPTVSSIQRAVTAFALARGDRDGPAELGGP